MLVSAVQQNESATCIHISPSSRVSLPQPPHPTSLGHHRAPSWVSCAIYQLPTSYLFAHIFKKLFVYGDPSINTRGFCILKLSVNTYITVMLRKNSFEVVFQSTRQFRKSRMTHRVELQVFSISCPCFPSLLWSKGNLFTFFILMEKRFFWIDVLSVLLLWNAAVGINTV